MSNYEHWLIISNLLVTVGLFGVVLVALFGKSIKEFLLPARLNVEILDKNGELTILDNGHRVVYYHLRVINESSVIVHNCRVFLKRMQKRETDGSYSDIPFSVLPRYIWSPAETSPEGIDIVVEQVIDFGYIIDSSKEFTPTVTPILNSFKGILRQSESIRYFIEIIGENYRTKKLTGIEVSWDGNWPENLDQMHEHLSIEKI
jgi:hypothetical protein